MKSSDLSLARSSFSANALFPSEINGENVVFQLCPFPSVRPAQISAPSRCVVAKNSSSLGIFITRKKIIAGGSDVTLFICDNPHQKAALKPQS